MIASYIALIAFPGRDNTAGGGNRFVPSIPDSPFVEHMSAFLFIYAVWKGILTMNCRCMNTWSHERLSGTTIDRDVGSADGCKHSNGIFGDPVEWSVAMDGRNLMWYEIKGAVRMNYEGGADNV